MSKYIGTPVVNISADTVDVTGDITTTDSTPEVTIVNNTHEDTDGGREGKVTFKGQQSGGEETTLAQIRAQHEGTSDDEKGELLFKTNDGSDGSSPTTALTINSEQKIGIGTTAPDNKLHVFESSTTQTASTESQLVLEKNSNSGITILSGQTSNGRILFGDSGDNDIGQIDYDHNNNSMSFVTNASERMRIDNSGQVGINNTSPNTKLDIIGSSTNGSGIVDTLRLRNTGATADDGARIQFTAGTSTSGAGIGSGGQALNSADLRFYAGGNTEAMRIDSSGRLLIGKTTGAARTTAGIELASNSGFTRITCASDKALELVRTGSDGEIIEFFNDSTHTGSMGVNGDRTYLSVPGHGIALDASGNSVLPCTDTGGNLDNSVDIGASSARYDDVFATNGTIQTSDEREKQQIASMTDAEIIAAKAISKLFKTFKWNDAVTEKGDNARTHAGVIAQQVETAMSDAGLDAGNYAFFISTTWWESDGEPYDTQEEAPEGATERNRKGIRYPELLSFIGAATEQRLTSIEARLDALEGE